MNFYQTVGTFLNWWLGLSGGTETSELLEHLGYGGDILTQDYEVFLGMDIDTMCTMIQLQRHLCFSLNKQY
ncbi:hypothetical protein GCM10020331_101770 [Ectobacillus funiculus]